MAITRADLQTFDQRFTLDNPGKPVGQPDTVGGSAVISAGIDRLPGAPRRVVLALPGNSACYYVMITDGRADEYGVALGGDAVWHCFVSETPGGLPQVRPETTWSTRWPRPTA